MRKRQTLRLSNSLTTRTDIEAAAARIAGHVRETPVLRVDTPSHGNVYLKLETLQHSGSFKPRGAFNTLLSQKIPSAGVIAASGGNHGAAVAYAAQQLGLRAEIFVPTIAAAAKVARIKSYGAHIEQIGANYSEALAACEARRAQTGALGIHAYAAPATIAGQGTIAREFEHQVPGLDAVLVAVGGGGLIGGVAAWFAGHASTQVIAVEPITSRALHAALEAGAPVDVSVSGIAADSLGATRVGEINFALCQAAGVRTVLVDDAQIRHAQTWLWANCRVVAEPGGAAALAALLSGKAGLPPAAKVGVIVCGANCDPASVVSA